MIDPKSKELTVRGGGGAGEIGNLTVHFILPGAGAFGRDKAVEFQQATHAKVEYQRDRQFVSQTIPVTDAAALVEQAQRDQEATAARIDEAGKRQAEEVAETRRKLDALACPVCGGRDFDEQLGREDSQWGMTTMRMRMLICKRCSYVLQFALGRSVFVPGAGGGNTSMGGMPGTGGMPGSGL
jgi:uncharacterized protein YbaR (Trm112 family)